ncbi:hypothetical protein [Legionella quateirensis]|uniref:Uncharacterized protein n=1 Tax=Legionella quateirensis TaxID=45072 RepID=A0A378KS25_9GAMM|nr:hypothetical protein [Legionella quateirensis]KTD44828.1 hypothetical protein Lqua_2663 [Legionella quateirensis]STY16287.1 Uncharacterised protein [Legionella quateirensis]
MSSELTISYLTGSAKVIRNNFSSDDIIWRKPRPLGQMFFQPYESKEEFIFCARHTIMPISAIALTILNPAAMLGVTGVFGGLSLVCAALGKINQLCGDERGASFFLDMADFLIKDLTQLLIDVLVLPLSLLALCSRGVSTGLQASGICSEQDETPSPTI